MLSGTGFQTTWRGATDAWECDQMGHMNVQFYGRKFDEAEAVMMSRLGLPAQGAAGLSPRALIDQIQFKRESRAGAVLHARTAVIGVDRAAGTIRLRHEMYQSATGTLSAVLDSVLGGADGGVTHPLPSRVLDAAQARMIDPASANAPVAPEMPGPVDGVSLAAADRFALRETLVGLVRPDDLAPSGLMTRQGYISRLSQAIGHLITGDEVSAEALRSRHIGSAALDYRVRWIQPSRTGDIVSLRSGFSGIVGRTIRIFHWLFDEASHRPLATVEIVAVYFDMQARKAIEVPEEIRRLLADRTAQWP